MARIARVGRDYLDCFSAPQPVRPTVLIQSDDWGRVGLPDFSSIARLKARFPLVGRSSWDYFGAESLEDIQKLGGVLSKVQDRDGRPACMTANVVMANADLRRMAQENFDTFRAVALHEGFPEPWPKWNVVGAYLELINAGVWYPALHGYTHFSPEMMLQAWHDTGDLGERARYLFCEDIPYLASVTPEFNFALLRRHSSGELFASREEQRGWVMAGVDLFQRCFGMKPLSTCAPGYRANETTYALWSDLGFGVVQTASGKVACASGGLLEIPRNVFFEPALSDSADRAVGDALRQAELAVSAGKIIVVCSHSINFMEQHLGRRRQSLEALKTLLNEFVRRWPDLRFAHDGDVHLAWGTGDRGWFERPSLSSVRRRLVRG
jgi:hypothetical protein